MHSAKNVVKMLEKGTARVVVDKALIASVFLLEIPC